MGKICQGLCKACHSVPPCGRRPWLLSSPTTSLLSVSLIQQSCEALFWKVEEEEALLEHPAQCHTQGPCSSMAPGTCRRMDGCTDPTEGQKVWRLSDALTESSCAEFSPNTPVVGLYSSVQSALGQNQRVYSSWWAEDKERKVTLTSTILFYHKKDEFFFWL